MRQKKLDARLNNIKLGPSRNELKRSKMSQSNCKVRIAVDLSFDDLMNDKVDILFYSKNEFHQF
jgi:tRNA (guanine9-N1)-methyltransferase